MKRTSTSFLPLTNDDASRINASSAFTFLAIVSLPLTTIFTVPALSDFIATDALSANTVSLSLATTSNFAASFSYTYSPVCPLDARTCSVSDGLLVLSAFFATI